jgi:DNA-binding CsgD family transcriptional regulator
MSDNEALKPSDIIDHWRTQAPADLPMLLRVYDEAGKRLTAREAEVLLQIVMGKETSAIAKALSISEKTVEKHTHNLLPKLRAENRTDAATRALFWIVLDLMGQCRLRVHRQNGGLTVRVLPSSVHADEAEDEVVPQAPQEPAIGAAPGDGMRE